MSVYEKELIVDPDFYIVKYTKNSAMPYLLFIHGGPGFNCGVIEYLIEHERLFDQLNYNIILYDQRACGRSPNTFAAVMHQDNINDLHKIIKHITDSHEIDIQGLIGHSYGAKILFDYCNQFDSNIVSIFVSTASSILTPRLNNLTLDLAYLKKTNPQKYTKILGEMNTIDLQKIWRISEELTTFFAENSDRKYLYWANLSCFEMVSEIYEKIGLPTNTDVFVSVRKDLYSNESNFSVSIDTLDIPYLWVNGFHDFIINGTDSLLSKNKNIITFNQSSHYPHIEENNHFCEVVNEFMQRTRRIS